MAPLSSRVMPSVTMRATRQTKLSARSEETRGRKRNRQKEVHNEPESISSPSLSRHRGCSRRRTLSTDVAPSQNKSPRLRSQIQRPSTPPRTPPRTPPNTPPKCAAARDMREVTRSVARCPTLRKRLPHDSAHAGIPPRKRNKIEQHNQAPSRESRELSPPQQTHAQMPLNVPVAHAFCGADNNLLPMDPASNSGAAQVPRQSARSTSGPAIDFAPTALLSGRVDASPISVESRSPSDHTEETPLKPEEEKCVSKDRCPPLSVLQGKWRSSYRKQSIVVDLIWLQINNKKASSFLKREGNIWTWFGWALVDVKVRALHWKKEDYEVVWKRIGHAPKLECKQFDLTGKTKAKRRLNSMDALGLLKRNFNVLNSVCKNPNTELYGLQFTQSKQGVFAACLLTRFPEKNMNIIVYIATRAPVQGVGLGGLLLQKVHAVPAHATGHQECDRWAALVCCSGTFDAALQWWQKRNYVNDVSEELGESNPFRNCSVLERGDQRKNVEPKPGKDMPVTTVDEEPDPVPICPVPAAQDDFEQTPKELQRNRLADEEWIMHKIQAEEKRFSKYFYIFQQKQKQKIGVGLWS
eukprot:GEMP01024596.1.p1 GENE.GEMP01024596.1~~GEMP01024596.1.p1  ORF type:complete len:581 (+),score=109.33 GEMP01024596.1:203-1945(+)